MANYNHWHTLDYSATYSFHHRNSTLRITNSSGLEMKVVCTLLKPSSRDDSSVVLLMHFTMGWYVLAPDEPSSNQIKLIYCSQSGFMCMSFYRRDMHVIEVQIGTQTKRQEDACNPAYFNRTNLPYVTLVSEYRSVNHTTTMLIAMNTNPVDNASRCFI